MATGLSVARSAHAAEDHTLKVGLIGCGGRGRGAAQNALKADANAKLVAVADAFPENAETAAKVFKNSGVKDQVVVTPETTFSGLDAYKKVIELSDVVLLCATPHFRPIHLKAAVDAGKHIFAEKPVAVCPAGIRSVMESAKKAKEKGLNLVSGLCWRYHPNVQEMMDRVRDGQIGALTAIQTNYLTGKLWTRARKPGDTEMMFQVRNWYNFDWLSGDFNVEQHVHSLDKAAWAFGDAAPVAAYGLGGRLVRTEQPEYGNIYDHMSVVYEFETEDRGIVKVFSFCRQMNNCFRETNDHFYGTKGVAHILSHKIEGADPYEIPKDKKISAGAMYDLEHVALFEAIRSGGEKYINNGHYMANSTMMGILGRMVCYSGDRITWEDAMKADLKMQPSAYQWDAEPPVMPLDDGRYPIALPGIGKGVQEI